MEHFKKIEADLNKFSELFPEYVNICKKYNAPHGLILGGTLSVIASIMLIF